MALIATCYEGVLKPDKVRPLTQVMAGEGLSTPHRAAHHEARTLVWAH